MTHLATREHRVPLKIEKSAIEGDALWLCQCGLSSKGMFCDGTHSRIPKDASGLWWYERTETGLVRRAIPQEPSKGADEEAASA